MRRRRSAILRLLVILLLAASLTVATGTAQAHGPDLLVSRSASGPFTHQLATPLLGGFGRVVPLDTAAGTFHVKNPTAHRARVTVSVVNRGDANALTGSLTMTVDVGGTVSTGRLPSDGRSCELVTTGPKLPPGGVQRVEVSFEVGNLTGQQGMGEQVALDVDVTLSHLGSSGDVAACGKQTSADPPVADCERSAVVTLAGPPRCVPTVVDAGLHDGLGMPRDPGAVAGTGLAVLVVGGLLLRVLWRRRRDPGPADA